MNEIPEPPIELSNRLTAIIRVPESDRKPLGHDVPNAYCVEFIEGFGGCIVWGWYECNKAWEVNVGSRWLIVYLLAKVAELYDATPCRLDHHGYCQEHVYFSTPCPHRLAQETLK